MNNIINTSNLHVDENSPLVWSLKLPPVVKNFIWRGLQKCVPTWHMSWMKGVRCPQNCLNCHVTMEKSWHLFTSCPFCYWYLKHFFGYYGALYYGYFLLWLINYPSISAIFGAPCYGVFCKVAMPNYGMMRMKTCTQYVWAPPCLYSNGRAFKSGQQRYNNIYKRRIMFVGFDLLRICLNIILMRPLLVIV